MILTGYYLAVTKAHPHRSALRVSHGGSVNHTESVIFFDTLIFEAIPTTKYA
jgi:hypothetical protein